MIEMRGKTYLCSACGWTHEEIDAAASIPPGMMAAFSPGLAGVMRAQSVERVAAALAKHDSECPKRNAANGAAV